MKNIQNTYVFVLVMLIVALTTFGCKGTGNGPLRENLLTSRIAPLKGQFAKTVTSDESGPAKIDFNAAKAEDSKVALASYISQTDKAKWLESYEEAVKLSQQSGKPILADFTGSNWCGPCMNLKNKVFDTPQFKAWAAENVILLELDYPRPNLQPDWIKRQNRMLAARYKIDRYPSVLILNTDGSVIGSQGPMQDSADRWISVADNTVKSNRSLRNAKMVEVNSLDNTK